MLVIFGKGVIMKLKIMIAGTAALLFISSLAGAAIYDNEIIVMFALGAVDWPPGETTMNIYNVDFTPPQLKDVFIAHGAQIISLAFPNADPADTIKYNSYDPTKFVRKIKTELVYKILLQDSKKREALNTELANFNEIQFSHNNGTIVLHTNDTYFNQQWNLLNTGQSGGVPGMDIDAEGAWAITHGQSDYIMGIMDTGVMTNHSDLNGKVTGDGPTESHGTHVAGIAGAITNNNTGIAGVAWNPQMISRNTFVADYPELYDIIWDLIDQVVVMNSSWSLNEGDVELIHSAFAAAYRLGDAMVAARGNEPGGNPNTDPFYPACFGEWMINVGAFKNNGYKASYSYYGSGMDFLAPGGDVPVNGAGIISTINYDPWYAWATGTSMAAPHVTGTIALLHDYSGFCFSEDYENLLKKTCVDMYPPGYDVETGWGRISAGAALRLVAPPNDLFVYESANHATPYLYSNTGQYTMRCIGWPAMYSRNYKVIRYEYRADITFADELPKLFSETPVVWGNGLLTNGLSDESPNYFVPYCGVVDGTLTPQGVRSRHTCMRSGRWMILTAVGILKIPLI